MRKNNKGFSLVELIVVIAIMAILAAVAVVSYSIYIERAQDASDREYIDNILYFSELYALEHELPLAWVEVAPEVNDKDDIKLIIQDTEGGYYSVTDEEIFNAVGTGKIQGGLNNGKYDGSLSGPGEGTEDLVTTPCQQHQAGKNEIDHKDPTCTEDGWIKYQCDSNGCVNEWYEIKPAQHKFTEVPSENSKYTYYVCDECGFIFIKGPDGSVIVPIN